MIKKVLKFLFLGFMFSILLSYVGVYGLVSLPIEIIFKPLLFPGILLVRSFLDVGKLSSGSLWLWLIIANGIVYSMLFFVGSLIWENLRRK